MRFGKILKFRIPAHLEARLDDVANRSARSRSDLAREGLVIGLEHLILQAKALTGDVSPSKNEGKAMGDAIATENNLSRIAQVSGPEAADTVRRMASREDLFAKDAARITDNIATAERLLGADEFPSPLLGNKQYANIGQRTLLGVGLEGVTRLMDFLARGAISQGRAKLATDAAKLLTKTGPVRDQAVKEPMDYASKLPKGNPLKNVIMQAVTPSVSATYPSLLGS